ncbi:PP2C family protein-serine/threonine phosphatase [Planctomicrobium sp. SH527]|uniref:PP2C family protein-serine/threonine phosphatase n=1 Tax=Planctomicrobium sp. SH527 TaxID=3448123 RepID=UPI003F5BB44C
MDILRCILHKIRGWPLGVHLLLAVNVPLGVLLAVLLVFEYQNRMDQAVTEKEASLADEAVAVHQAVLQLTQANSKSTLHSTAEFIEQVCWKMQSGRSPGHTIVVSHGGEILHSHGADHGHTTIDAEQELIQAFLAGRSQIFWQSEAVVLGGYRENDTIVVIAELATNIRRLARSESMWHLAGLMSLSFLAALIVGVVLWQLIRKPIREMSITVDAVANGSFGVPLSLPVGRELQVLANSFNLMSESLAANESQRRLQMEQAREIQQHLLPNDVKIPGLSICPYFQPAEDVAGDYYDIIPLSNGSWLILVADVAGHGIPAAMAATILKSLIICASLSHESPTEILTQVNQQFASLLPSGRFVTLILGVWHPASRRMTYVNSGHPAGLIWSPIRGFRELAATGMPIGIISDDVSFEAGELEIVSEDRLVWFTDGLIEAFSPDGELFGMNRLRDLIAQNGMKDPEHIQKEILTAVKEFAANEAFKDDLTFLVIG